MTLDESIDLWQKEHEHEIVYACNMDSEVHEIVDRVNPWQTDTPTESGEYLVCIRYDFGKEGYTTANYVEPYNPHTGWYNLKPPSEEDGHEWCKKNGIEIIAYQKIEPYKEKEDG